SPDLGQQRLLERVALGVHLPHTLGALLAVARRVDVDAGGDKQAVEVPQTLNAAEAGEVGGDGLAARLADAVGVVVPALTGHVFGTSDEDVRALWHGAMVARSSGGLMASPMTSRSACAPRRRG